MKKLKLLDIYLITAIVNIIAVATALFVTNGQFLAEIVWDARHDLFIDFTGCEGDHVGQVSYGFYYILGRFIPDGVIDDSTVTRWSEMFCVIFIVLCVIVIILISERYLNTSLAKTVMFSLVFAVSAPFGFACIKAGNTIYVSLMLIVLAMYLRESDNPIAREAALLCIALATDLKLAPAILGLLYLREKRYKEAIRLAIYGAVMVILPPILFGGIERYMEVMTEHSGLVSPRPETITGVVLELADVLNLSAGTGLIIGKVISYIYLAICIALLFIYKKNWKTLCLIMSILVIFLNMSYPYTLCYFLIPLLYFLKEETECSTKNIVYAVLFALIFTVYPIIRINWPTATFITNYFFTYIFVGMIIIDVIRDLVKKNEN